MGMLDNQRHELFAQNVANGMSLTDAAKSAGYSHPGQQGHRLLNNAEITARVQEIKEASAERAEISRASILELVQDIIDEAREAGQYGPAMTGAVKLGVDIGMFEQKTSNKHYFKPVNDMTEEELKAFLGNDS